MRRSLGLVSLAMIFVVQVWAAGALSNRRAPGFSLPDLNLKQHDLQDYRGKLVLLTIMRTDCPHCSVFSKALARAEQKYPGKVKAIGIVNTPPETQTTVRNYLSKNGIRQLTLFDCRQVAISYLRLTPQRSSFDVPHLFVIDQKGWIQEDHGYNALNRGLFEGDAVFSIIEKYLGKSSEAETR